MRSPTTVRLNKNMLHLKQTANRPLEMERVIEMNLWQRQLRTYLEIAI